MILSRERILTTHVGSLPRSKALTDLLIAREKGEAMDEAQVSLELGKSVRDTMQRQAEAGIDIGNDGEQQRVGFQTYIPERMSGFGGVSKRKIARDFAETPELVELFLQRFPHRAKITHTPQAVGELKYGGLAPINDEIARIKRSIPKSAFLDVFVTAPSPGIVATTMVNAFYDSHVAYLNALARELAVEYRAIIEAGFLLQIDAPDLAMERTMTFQDYTESEFLTVCESHVAAINAALDGLPAERVRLHCCYGNWEGPHNHDIALQSLLPLLYQAKVSSLSLEFANPRHQHEYEALKVHPLPAHMSLMPGTVDTTTNFVEHPELVARRIMEAVAAVGDRERVIASADCGFGTFTGREWVVAPVVWMKLAALCEGADLASRRLWGKSAAV